MKWMNRTFPLFILAISFLNLLYGEIQINENITQFRYPKFSEKGFIEWVLEGNSGTYNQSLISIDKLNLRVYSGDQKARSLSNITGASCIFDSDTQIATSRDSILIEGSGFDLSGNQWSYDLSKEIIDLKSDASVSFSQNIDSIFSGFEQTGETKIKSNHLRLIIEPTRYLFNFEGDCELSSDSFILKSEFLQLELLNSSNKVSFSIPTGELSGMKSINGEGDVQFIGLGKFIESDSFTIYPQDNKAIFRGKALIQYDQINLRGDMIDLGQNQVEVFSSDTNLSSFSNSIDNNGDSTDGRPSTFIQSRNISLLKKEGSYEYIFDDDVFFESKFYRINSEWLFLRTKDIASVDSSGMLQDITLTEAKENVIVRHDDYQISGENLRYLPLENQMAFNGNVSYTSDFARLKSNHLMIENNTVFAFSKQDFIEVVLPDTPDLNFEFINDSNDPIMTLDTKTVVKSQDLKINIFDSFYDCVFSGIVDLSKSDFSMKSDELRMKWKPVHANNVGIINTSDYEIDTMIADGSVTMEQLDYYASANNVEILPKEKLFNLLGNAYFKDSNGSIWGERIEFDRKSKQTKVIGEENGSRARIQFDIFDTEEENLEEIQKNDVK